MHRSPGLLGPSYRFGPFVADTAFGRLYCGTDEVPLTPKSFKVLVVLLEMQRQLVSKEDLFQQVWPDTFVEANNLARNISMIRKALHERDPDHEYIVTVTGRGYRFVAPVSRAPLTEESPPVALTTPDPGPATTAPVEAPARAERPTGYPWRTAALVAGLVALGAVVVLTRPSAPVEAHQPERRLWKLTSASRFESEPAWSPDGKWIAYSSDRSGNFDIWIQPVGDGTPVQITFNAARDWQPSWSRDGRSLAFRSERDGGGLFVVPALGGAERRITDFGYQPQWSPDASRILFTEAQELFLVGLDGAAPARVAAAELASVIGRFRVGWHPD